MSDWAEDDEAGRVSDEIHCTQLDDTVPSDWENLVEEDMEPDRERFSFDAGA